VHRKIRVTNLEEGLASIVGEGFRDARTSAERLLPAAEVAERGFATTVALSIASLALRLPIMAPCIPLKL